MIEMIVAIAFAFLVAPGRTLAQEVPTEAQITAAVEPVLTEVSRLFNMSFSFGYADGESGSQSFGFDVHVRLA
jgi:hypothetical protein